MPNSDAQSPSAARSMSQGDKKPPRFAGLSEERLKGLEPSTFCMASGTALGPVGHGIPGKSRETTTTRQTSRFGQIADNSAGFNAACGVERSWMTWTTPARPRRGSGVARSVRKGSRPGASLVAVLWRSGQAVAARERWTDCPVPAGRCLSAVLAAASRERQRGAPTRRRGQAGGKHIGGSRRMA